MFEFLASIPVIGGGLSGLLAFLIVITLIVFVHEYGHYIVGRWSGIHAEAFSIGFGPVLFARRDRRGTLWQVALLPLGGYVRFAGDRDASSTHYNSAEIQALSEAERRRSFPGAPLWARAATVAAGPFANFIFSVLIFAASVMYYGMPGDSLRLSAVHATPVVADAGEAQAQVLRAGDVLIAVNDEAVEAPADLYRMTAELPSDAPLRYLVLRDEMQLSVIGPHPWPVRIGGVEPLSAASDAGLREGDIILQAGSAPLTRFTDLVKAVQSAGDAPLELTIWRVGETFTVALQPQLRDVPDGQGGYEKRHMIGMMSGPALGFERAQPGLFAALQMGAAQVVSIITLSIDGIYHMITGDIGLENLQGPLGIGHVSSEMAQQGWADLIRLIAVISTAIGFLNLLPIPVFDGGHLVAFAYEALSGKRPHEKVMHVLTIMGLALVLTIMIFATYNDIMRF